MAHAMKPTLCAVLLNDTRPDLHHGCGRVVRLIAEKLERQGVALIATSPVRHAWWEDAGFLGALERADLVVINGEGTLHHGTPHGLNLLRVAEHPLRGAKPVYLINALYQDNPPEWAALLSAMTEAVARDTRSAAALAEHLGRPVRTIPDLTLCDGPLPSSAQRRGIVFGDSVHDPLSIRLAELSLNHPGSRLVPILTHLKAPKGRTAVGRALRAGYVAVHTWRFHRRFPNLELCSSETDYAAALGRAELHVTGRFHGVCYSILTGTPFLAIGSNSWKLEALLADFGLSPTRLQTPEGVERALRDPSSWAYTDSELAAIGSALSQAQADSDGLFSEMAAATASGRTP